MFNDTHTHSSRHNTPENGARHCEPARPIPSSATTTQPTLSKADEILLLAEKLYEMHHSDPSKTLEIKRFLAEIHRSENTLKWQEAMREFRKIRKAVEATLAEKGCRKPVVHIGTGNLRVGKDSTEVTEFAGQRYVDRARKAVEKAIGACANALKFDDIDPTHALYLANVVEALGKIEGSFAKYRGVPQLKA